MLLIAMDPQGEVYEGELLYLVGGKVLPELRENQISR